MDELPKTSVVNLLVDDGTGGVYRDWFMVTTGTWLMVRDASDEDASDSFREYNRLRDSGRQWAVRHRYQIWFRRRDNGRKVWVKTTRIGGS